jgi:hypothetical protein
MEDMTLSLSLTGVRDFPESHDTRFIFTPPNDSAREHAQIVGLWRHPAGAHRNLRGGILPKAVIGMARWYYLW